jgi:hypothetical protein
MTEPQQRAIFAALAEELAAGRHPVAARFAVAKRFTVTVLKVEAVEQEGLRRGWSTA